MECSDLSSVGELRLKVMEETGKPSEEAENLISEAIGLLGEGSSLTRKRSPERNVLHQVEDNRDADLEVKNSEVDPPKNISPEQIFWFRLADSDVEESR